MSVWIYFVNGQPALSQMGTLISWEVFQGQIRLWGHDGSQHGAGQLKLKQWGKRKSSLFNKFGLWWWVDWPTALFSSSIISKIMPLRLHALDGFRGFSIRQVPALISWTVFKNLLWKTMSLQNLGVTIEHVVVSHLNGRESRKGPFWVLLEPLSTRKEKSFHGEQWSLSCTL